MNQSSHLDKQLNSQSPAALLRLPVLVSDTRLVKLAIEAAALRYGQAAEIEARAWEMFNEGIDAGYTYEATGDLLKHAKLAESIRTQAYRELSDAKALLLSLAQ
jgi:hypothetical protein